MASLRLHVLLLPGHQQTSIPTEPLSESPAIQGPGKLMREFLDWKPLTAARRRHWSCDWPLATTVMLRLTRIAQVPCQYARRPPHP